MNYNSIKLKKENKSMNNFKELAKLVKNRKENINFFYDLLDSEQ